MSAGLAEVLAEHREWDVWGADLDPEEAEYVRSTPDTAEAVAAYVPHLTAAVTEWLGERLRGVREDVRLAVLEQHEFEYDEHEKVADVALAVVGKALGIEVDQWAG